MIASFLNLWRWSGTLDRGPYALAGVLLFAAKYNLDRVVSTLLGREWMPWAYLKVPGTEVLTALTAGDLRYCLSLLAIAFPFIWIGTALTTRRLRDAALSRGLVVLFFAPLLNLLFFAILCVVPGRTRTEEPSAPPQPMRRWLDRAIPASPLGSAAMAVLLTVPAGLLGIWLSVRFFEQYGWGLFVGLPFGLGMVAALLHGYHRPQPLHRCVGVACLAVAVLGGMLLILAVEGLICLVMAAPLALGLAALGASVGYVMQKGPAARNAASPTVLTVLVGLPLLLGLDGRQPAEPPLVAVRTALEVDAPPEAVWDHLVSFSTLPEPEDWLFRTGIAYPIRAEIDGEGVGAVRHCIFTTGAFVEPITAWDAPYRLAFSVAAQPHPMQEWTLYEEVHPPHLDGYFRTERGQFLLTSLPGGRTRLEGTTWYRHDLWPQAYWQPWSTFVLHRIHRRVLKHIQHLSEAAAL
jgi:hypothetical protein